MTQLQLIHSIWIQLVRTANDGDTRSKRLYKEYPEDAAVMGCMICDVRHNSAEVAIVDQPEKG